jgi:hypothetical protein
MPLNPNMRGQLEDLIDRYVSITPFDVKVARNMPPELNIKTEEDYVLGFVQGSIMGML